MDDLFQAILVMMSLSLAVGILSAVLVGPSKLGPGNLDPGKKMASTRQGQGVVLMLTIVVTCMFAFLFYSAGRLYWAKWIDDSAVIVWSNFTPLLAAIAAGIVYRLPNTPHWRQSLLAMSLGFASLATVLWPFVGVWLRPPPEGGDEVFRGITLQTSWATCSPCAAATFLRAGGIEASEKELIPLCLTDESGTPTLGLFRGVKWMANRHHRDVQALTLSLDQLESENIWPVLIMVELPISGVDDPRYADQWGWVPGLGHSVVLLGKNSRGGFVVADPAVGAEIWTRADLEVLWHGNAIRFRE
tara:strand:- start:3850 stop:4755 length:906 start_codon:yes stop_codon:yes gene_type:complete